MPRIDLPTGNSWLLRFRKRGRFDNQVWQRGPFGSFELRLRLWGWTLKLARQRTRWL
jgi:hypothetical protein